MKPFRRVAVLGAGTMGSRIAAHFANAGIPALLLDVVIPGQPNRDAAARAGLDAALKQKPGAFFTPAAAALVTPGNFEDHLAELSRCDWVVEAVTENLEIKRSLLARVAEVRAPGAVLSTNTSGIPLARISEGFGAELRQHFLGTHFFNPPRYLHLVEIIPGAQTLPEVVRACAEFCDLHLGKGVVPCKDTPNFIGNRIGCFFGATIQKLTVEGGYTVEEVDAITGPLIGLPWEQEKALPRGEVTMEHNYAITMELRTDGPVPEWNGQTVRCPMEEPVVFTREGCSTLKGRQMEFYLI